MSLQVRLAARAAAEIREIVAWWREHRAAAAQTFEDELNAAVAWLAAFPQGGQPYDVPEGRPVRRTVLRRSRYYLY